MVKSALYFVPLLFLPQDEKGFEKLFNGKDLRGWKFALEGEEPDPAKAFRVQDGVLVCTGDPAGYAYTERSFKNFTLRFDWRYKRPEGLKEEKDFPGNSGYLLFVTKSAALGIWPQSVEVQGMNRDAGKILPIPRDLKCKYEDFPEARKRALKPVGEWNAMEIVAKEGTVLVRLNGEKVAAVSECEIQSGPIGFQSEGAEIHWRNIRIQSSGAVQ